MDEQVKTEVREILKEITANESLLGKDLLLDRDSHEAITCLHRCFHTLKGIFGMVGLGDLNLLSTIWQDFFKLLQLGKVKFVPGFFELLALSLRQIENVLNQTEPEKHGEVTELNDIASQMADLVEAHKVEGRSADELAELFQSANVSSQVIGVLTEAEEARLELNIENGKGLFLIIVSYSIEEFDKNLRQFQAEAKSLGEVICLQPIQAGCPEEIAFKILFASTDSREDMAQGFSVDIREIEQLRQALGNDAFCDDGVAEGF